MTDRCRGASAPQWVIIATITLTGSVLPWPHLYAQPTVGVPGNPLGLQSPLTAAVADRPFRALFGPAPAAKTTTQQMEFTGSLFGMRSGITNGAVPVAGDRTLTNADSFGGLAMLNYSLLLSNVSLGAFGGTSINYYRDVRSPFQVGYSGGVGATTRLGRRTTLGGYQTVSYAPFFGFYPYAGLLPLKPGDVQPSVPNDQYLAGSTTSLNLYTNARLTHTLDRRSSIGAFYDMNRTEFERTPNSTWYSAGVSYTRGLSRHASLRAGYTYQNGLYTLTPTLSLADATTHDLNLGVDYSRALSPWRRTSITFGTGSTLARRLDDSQTLSSHTGPLTLFVTGFAAINRELGRSWNVRGTFERSVNYQPGFVAPFFSSAASAAAGGSLGRRLSVHTMFMGSLGTVGLAPSGTSAKSYGNDFWAYSATANAQYGLASHWALYASYAYYNYLFGSAVALPIGMLSATGRQSIQAGLTTWWPVFKR